jgi:large subunit ribosomal protein L24
MNIKKNDNVIVVAGSDKGKTGKVLKVFRDANKVIVEGINVRKVHKKKTAAKAGAIIEMSAPVNASNVQLLDGNKPTRVKAKMINDKKVRVAVKSGNEIK